MIGTESSSRSGFGALHGLPHAGAVHAALVWARAITLGLCLSWLVVGCGPPDDGGDDSDALIDTTDSVAGVDSGDPDGTEIDGGCQSDDECSGQTAGACQTATCDLDLGACELVDDPDGTPCDDEDACTLDEQCVAGSCTGTAMNCDDGDACTDDLCFAGVCSHPFNTAPCDDGNPCTSGDICGLGVCQGSDNGCPCGGIADCAPFDDGNACTGVIDCTGGYCSLDPATIPNCASLNGPCATAACDPDTGNCDVTWVANGVLCEDGDPCTVAEACSDGACVPVFAGPCNDGNPCTIDACPGGAGCAHTSAADGSGCNDDNPCTEGESCQSGVCSAVSTTECNDGNPCTVDVCQPGGGCVYTPTTGGCDDGNACTTGETCATGQCAGGAPVQCDDNDICTAEVCSPVSGCLYEQKANGAACTDGDACTKGDRCVNGVCTPLETTSCDDGDPCTADACDSSGQCVAVPAADGTPCDDGDICTTQETCIGGQCTSDEPPCDPCAVGGDWTPCDDGNPDTVGDLCQLGSCSGFSKRLYLPSFGAVSAQFEALAVTQTQVFGLGRSLEPEGFALTWAAELQGKVQAPALTSSSIRIDTEYVAASNGVAVGNTGAVSAFNGTLWDTNTNLNAALATVATPAAVTGIWGTTLQNIPGAKRDVWFLTGEAMGGGPWLVRCLRESAGGGGFQWFCGAESGLSPLLGRLDGMYGRVGPCSSAGCTGLEVQEGYVSAEALTGPSSFVAALKAGSWVTVADVGTASFDRWRGIGGAGESVWIVGTKGLVSSNQFSGWPAVALPGGPAQAEVDFNDVWVTENWVYAVGTRLLTTFGKLNVESYLVIWPNGGAGSLAAARWVKLGTSACPSGECVEGEFDLGASLRAVGIGGVGSFFGIYALGYEWADGKRQSVVYFRGL